MLEKFTQKAILSKLLHLNRKTCPRVRENIQLKKTSMQETQNGDPKSVPRSTKKKLSKLQWLLSNKTLLRLHSTLLSTSNQMIQNKNKKSLSIFKKQINKQKKQRAYLFLLPTHHLPSL